MTHDDPTTTSHLRLPGRQPVRMRGPADMAAMLPYLIGFYPDDSIVAVGLHGPAARQGGAIRLDIPENPVEWPRIAGELVELLIALSEQRDERPDAVLLYLVRDPEPGADPVMAQLRPLAGHLLEAAGAFGLQVREALCLSGGRWWSFLCTDPACCDFDGTAVFTGRDPGAAVVAATYAGLAPRGSRKAIAAALAPIDSALADPQRHALEREMGRLVQSLTEPHGERREMAAIDRLIAQAMAESRSGPPKLDDDQTARLIVGLQNRNNRDRGAEYAEPDELVAAQHLWRFLARRCVPPYHEFAKAPLTLLAWTSWLAGDSATSRVALAGALDLDPSYTLADLLYHSLNGGLEPEGLLRVVRRERARRMAGSDRGAEADASSETALSSGAGGPSESAGPPEAAQRPTAPAAPVGSAGGSGSPAVPRRKAGGRRGRRRRSGHGADSAAGPSTVQGPPPAVDRGLIPPQRGAHGSGESRPPATAAPPPAPDQPSGGAAPPPEAARSRFAGLLRRDGRHGVRKTSTSTSTIGA
ncbi:DUF4192 domain-containing protein [Kitasatospora sp. NBC_01266]|uniref:DUF4192 domain-containing protein n=1 Tax=Kitasatospora sp. NBC_01266 TaxID=2903572 RepID=UPI002E3691DA|nr:DUF4192 family protein [Kitasatospora sp. NBC_01266]